MKILLVTLSTLAASVYGLPEAACPGKCADRGTPSEFFKFTSTYNFVATPDQVVNGTTPTGGQPGTYGYYDFGFNGERNYVCYHIRLVNFDPAVTYQSPALTATHIHEAARGQSGLPRIAFPNPTPKDGSPRERVSFGCMKGPFLTGVRDPATGKDSGEGFQVAQIEMNPAAFFADVHTNVAVAGAVRGQFL